MLFILVSADCYSDGWTYRATLLGADQRKAGHCRPSQGAVVWHDERPHAGDRGMQELARSHYLHQRRQQNGECLLRPSLEGGMVSYIHSWALFQKESYDKCVLTFNILH